MKRKVSLIGPSTLMVSLPSAWCKKYSVKKGDDMNVDEKDKNLIIGFNTSSVKTVREADLTNFDILIHRRLRALYISGADEIRVKFEEPKIIEKVQKELRNGLIGFEVVEQSKNSCTIKCISEESNSEFDSLLRRIFILLQSMGNDISENLSKKEYNLEYIQFTDHNINRFTNFCLRYLNKKGYKDYEKTCVIYSLIQGLEYLGDLYKKIGMEISKNKKADKDIIKIISLINSQFTECHHLFYKFDEKKAVEVAKNYYDIFSRIEKLQPSRLTALIQELNLNIVMRILDSELTIR